MLSIRETKHVIPYQPILEIKDYSLRALANINDKNLFSFFKKKKTNEPSQGLSEKENREGIERMLEEELVKQKYCFLMNWRKNLYNKSTTVL